MATEKPLKYSDKPVLPMEYGQGFEYEGGAASVMDTELDRVFWDPKTGKAMMMLEDGEWVELPLDENGEFIPKIPDKRY